MIKSRIKQFKKDLFLLDENKIFSKHILDVETYLFVENPTQEDFIKNTISTSFCIDPSCVRIIGSAKLGYSLSPKKLFRHIDEKFEETHRKEDKSDIDVAIISEDLFFGLQKKFYKFSNSLKKEWNSNQYYKSESKNIPRLDHSFYKYNYKGWFRIDYKPRDFEVCENSSLEELKRTIKKETGRKIGIAIYQNSYFFDVYHCDNIRNLKLQLQSDKL